MWANAQRDGRPAYYRWRPLLNAAVWLTPTTSVPCSNAAKTRNPLKFAGVPQTRQQISAVSRSIQAFGYNKHWPKIRGGRAVPLWGKMGPHLTQCRLGRGLPPYEEKLQLECGPMPNVMANQPNIGSAVCESSVIPFVLPCHKVWLTATNRVPCSNAANTERKTWKQSEVCSWQNSLRGQEPP